MVDDPRLKQDRGSIPLDALAFPDVLDGPTDEGAGEADGTRYICPLCRSSLSYTTAVEVLGHLKEEHSLLIADVHLICDLSRYLRHWQKRFEECPIDQLHLPTTAEGDRRFFILSDQVKGDNELRQGLQVDRLKVVLRAQQRERQDQGLTARCLFCQELYTGNRSELFNHMAQDHNFNVGLPDNLVFTEEFLRVLRAKMDSLQCLYCEKNFRDKVAIREHMRKKQHRKLNPNNSSYDKYYIINYLELGKGWQAVQAEQDGVLQEKENDNWDDWRESVGATAVCLFCEHASAETSTLLEHMRENHGFDMNSTKTKLKLNFYKQLKLVNYIRRRVHQRMCYSCRDVYPSQHALVSHMTESGHILNLPDCTEWDQPQYYIPTYDNDTLLFGLEDDDEGDSESMQTPIVAEEIKVDLENSVLKDVQVRSSLVSR